MVRQNLELKYRVTLESVMILFASFNGSQEASRAQDRQWTRVCIRQDRQTICMEGFLAVANVADILEVGVSERKYFDDELPY